MDTYTQEQWVPALWAGTRAGTSRTSGILGLGLGAASTGGAPLAPVRVCAKGKGQLAKGKRLPSLPTNRNCVQRPGFYAQKRVALERDFCSCVDLGLAH